MNLAKAWRDVPITLWDELVEIDNATEAQFFLGYALLGSAGDLDPIEHMLFDMVQLGEFNAYRYDMICTVVWEHTKGEPPVITAGDPSPGTVH